MTQTMIRVRRAAVSLTLPLLPLLVPAAARAADAPAPTSPEHAVRALERAW